MSKRTSLSFEVFPPKKEEEFENIFEFLREAAKLHPDFISCTYGAGGSRAGKTIEIASFIQKELGINAIAHITCVGFTKADLEKNCEALEAAGVNHVLALRGDRPQHMTDEQFNSREFFYATDLVRHLKAHTSLQISGACYPEKHFESPSLEEDLTHLKEKVDAGVTSLVTQMFFDNACFYRFIELVRAKGITVPIHAGIMPITTAKQLGTTVSLSGLKKLVTRLKLSDGWPIFYFLCNFYLCQKHILHLLQGIPDLNMLRACLLALAALDAGVGRLLPVTSHQPSLLLFRLSKPISCIMMSILASCNSKSISILSKFP